MAIDRDRLITSFRLQAGGCRLFGSPFYAELMAAALEDVLADGPVARLVAEWEGDPLRGFLPLRLFAAVHEQVLAGDAPELAPYYPTVGGRADAKAAWPAIRALLEERAEALRPRLENFPQTNEVRRCAGLLGGFLEAAARTGLPLRLREIGCSAGLNLQWSRFHYELGDRRWGDAASPVRIVAEWLGPPARFDTAPGIESRAGCDVAPRRIGRDDEVRVLEAFVWPDQPERLEQLRGAVRIARADPPRVERAPAGEWLVRELAEPSQGSCLVVYHSAMWLYLPAEEQARIRERIEARGARATPRDPLAWLRHEDGDVPGQVEVHLRLWPPDEELHLARGHPHGRRVEWLLGGDALRSEDARAGSIPPGPPRPRGGRPG